MGENVVVVPVTIDTEDVVFNEMIAGKRDFPLVVSEFRRFLELERCEESLEFLEKVEAFNKRPSVKFLKEILDEFIKIGSPKEINISAAERQRILNDAIPVMEGVLPVSGSCTIFENGNKEVRKIMQHGPYFRFLSHVSKSNMPTDIASMRLKRGFLSISIGWAITVTLILFQLLDEKKREVSRWWRLFGVPFLFFGSILTITAYNKICPCLLAPEVIRGFFYRTGRAIEVKEDIVRNRMIRRAILVLSCAILSGIIMCVIALCLPPGNDIYNLK